MTSPAFASDETFHPEAPASEILPISFTDKAIEMVVEARKQEGLGDSHGLRVAVQGGGCSGFQYGLDFEGEEKPGDTVLTQGGVKIFVDMFSIGYLNGTVVDYVDGLYGSGSSSRTRR